LFFNLETSNTTQKLKTKKSKQKIQNKKTQNNKIKTKKIKTKKSKQKNQNKKLKTKKLKTKNSKHKNSKQKKLKAKNSKQKFQNQKKSKQKKTQNKMHYLMHLNLVKQANQKNKNLFIFLITGCIIIAVEMLEVRGGGGLWVFGKLFCGGCGGGGYFHCYCSFINKFFPKYTPLPPSHPCVHLCA
jgi:hypothetical protein